MNEAENLSRSVRDAAAAITAHIVPAPLDTGNQPTMPRVMLSADEFTALVHAVRPRIIYLFETIFDLEQEVETALEEAGMEQGGKAARAVRRVAERLRDHEGEIARVFAEVVFDGVHHIAFEAASWVEAFESEVETIAAKEQDENAVRGQQMSAAHRTRARDLANQLTADPAFSAGRVSFAKRRFLAGELFPDEDHQLLDTVVELAENMHWLASAKA